MRPRRTGISLGGPKVYKPQAFRDGPGRGSLDARNNHEAGAQETVAERRRESSAMPTRPRVLLAEDHPALAKAVCRVLELDCDVVATVVDGSAVLEAVLRLKPDVIVVDVNLPNVNGLEACRQIRHVNPEAKVIVFSAMNDPIVTSTIRRGRSVCLCL